MQSENQSFTCFIVGEGTLPIKCAEVLLHRGHNICGIISPDATVNRWGEGKNIPCADATDDLIAFLRRRPFEYLFSIVNITNYQTLLQESLKLPRKSAINYHDALLPRRAGFYPTSWALMDREPIHGVTWHLMTDLIDAGDILKQCFVDIADDDTAFTLNAKCYDAAVRSFAELVEDLSLAQVSRRKQNLDQRSYSPLYGRPRAGCVLDWNQRAYDIDAFIRALDFGPYPNPLGLPKLALGKDFLIIGKIDVLDSVSETPHGVLTAIDHGSLTVSTLDRDVALRKVLTIDGQPLPIPDLVARFNLHEGDRFRELDSDIARRITEYHATVCQHEDFWVKRLSTREPITLSHALPNVAHVKPAQYPAVPIRLPEQIITFLEAGRGSSCDFLLAAFAAYLSRNAGVCRFDIGFSSVGLRHDLAGLEGFFASHVPLRVDLDFAQSFREFLDSVRERADLVKRHQTYARDVMARYPIFRSTPSLQTTLPVIVEQVEKLDGYQPVPGAELTVVISENNAECRWVYAPDVLDENNVTRMAGQFATFLQAIVNDPSQRIAELPLLTGKERHHLLVELNNSQTDYPDDRCLHQLFEAQVERTPQAIAVVFENKQITYQELNARANQLAHYLGKLGVGPEVLVGICVERSLEMIVGLVAILKAGGAYVPMDSRYPIERLAFVLEDSRASVLITERQLLDRFPENTRSTVCLDRDWGTITQESRSNPLNDVTVKNSAYVIYTSGTTGRPKGVMIEHQSLVNYLCWFNSSPLAKGLRRLPVITMPTFDASLKQLFAPLLRGAEVWLPPGDIVNQTVELLQSMGSQSGVGLNCVPSLWAVMLDAIDSKKAAVPSGTLSSLFLGGEQLGKQLVDRTFATLPHIEIWNLYGPTEATANASVGIVAPDDALTLGRPIANTQIYILDHLLQPVPIGVPGELFIGGAGLARGYLERSELTAEKFVPNPFGNKPGARLYRTGDMARYLADGRIEFLGRLDHQVKIRGFRIELGEVETALSSYPGVREAVVVAHEDNSGDKRLVAYLVPDQGQKIAVSHLRAFLRQKLPDYMVPLAFIKLEALPLAPNGKLDRRSLPAPHLSASGTDRVHVPPQNQLEKSIIEICQQVFNVENVGTEDNFFDLGGHSLMMMQVTNRLSNVTGRHIPFVQMFQYPTIRTFARSLSQDSDTQPSLQQSDAVLPPLRPYRDRTR